MRLKLIPGKEYLFTHKRLRTFRARYVGIVRAPATDPNDEYYLECECLDVDHPFRPEVFRLSSSTLIRPSLVTLIQDVPPNFSPRITEYASPTESDNPHSEGRLKKTVRRLLRSIRIG